MICRGIRGAVCADSNQADAIVAATQALLKHIVEANTLSVADVASVIFTATPDLNAAYPAQAARELGWTRVPLLCLQEMSVQRSLPRCIRVLIHWNTARGQDEIQHVYLGRASTLRPDLATEGAETKSTEEPQDE
ncbi:MAG: chorismate mutase [Anaerolineae bacterium]|jgi:chorismate mutase